MKKTLFIFVLLTIALRLCAAGDVQFTVTAPKAVVKGQQFRISYTVNTQKVKNFRERYPLNPFLEDIQDVHRNARES